MSHSTVLVVIRDADSASDAQDKLDTLLEPFNENEPLEVPELNVLDEASLNRAVNYYREHTELWPLDPDDADQTEIPVASYDEFVKDATTEIEWMRQAVGAYEVSDRNRGVYKDGSFGYLSTYNPKSRWDWWSLGGRWHGFFQVKPNVQVGGEPLPEWRQKVGPVGKEEGRKEGVLQLATFDGRQDAILGGSGVFGDDEGENFQGRADLARKGDIDFDAMRSLAAQRADLTYDKFEEATKGLEVPPTWSEYMTKTFFDNNFDPDGISEINTDDERKQWMARRQEILGVARTKYHEIPWVKALRDIELYSFFGEAVETFYVHTGGRAAYVKNAHDSATSTFAVLLDGEWYERGHMGWFGMASNEQDPEMWVQEQAKMIDSLPDDVFLAVVDVHI